MPRKQFGASGCDCVPCALVALFRCNHADGNASAKWSANTVLPPLNCNEKGPTPVRITSIKQWREPVFELEVADRPTQLWAGDGGLSVDLFSSGAMIRPVHVPLALRVNKEGFIGGEGTSIARQFLLGGEPTVAELSAIASVSLAGGQIAASLIRELIRYEFGATLISAGTWTITTCGQWEAANTCARFNTFTGPIIRARNSQSMFSQALWGDIAMSCGTPLAIDNTTIAFAVPVFATTVNDKGETVEDLSRLERNEDQSVVIPVPAGFGPNTNAASLRDYFVGRERIQFGDEQRLVQSRTGARRLRLSYTASPSSPGTVLATARAESHAENVQVNQQFGCLFDNRRSPLAFGQYSAVGCVGLLMDWPEEAMIYRNGQLVATIPNLTPANKFVAGRWEDPSAFAVTDEEGSYLIFAHSPSGGKLHRTGALASLVVDTTPPIGTITQLDDWYYVDIESLPFQPESVRNDLSRLLSENQSRFRVSAWRQESEPSGFAFTPPSDIDPADTWPARFRRPNNFSPWQMVSVSGGQAVDLNTLIDGVSSYGAVVGVGTYATKPGGSFYDRAGNAMPHVPQMRFTVHPDPGKQLRGPRGTIAIGDRQQPTFSFDPLASTGVDVASSLMVLSAVSSLVLRFDQPVIGLTKNHIQFERRSAENGWQTFTPSKDSFQIRRGGSLYEYIITPPANQPANSVWYVEVNPLATDDEIVVPLTRDADAGAIGWSDEQQRDTVDGVPVTAASIQSLNLNGTIQTGARARLACRTMWGVLPSSWKNPDTINVRRKQVLLGNTASLTRVIELDAEASQRQLGVATEGEFFLPASGAEITPATTNKSFSPRCPPDPTNAQSAAGVPYGFFGVGTTIYPSPPATMPECASPCAWQTHSSAICSSREIAGLVLTWFTKTPEAWHPFEGFLGLPPSQYSTGTVAVSKLAFIDEYRGYQCEQNTWFTDDTVIKGTITASRAVDVYPARQTAFLHPLTLSVKVRVPGSATLPAGLNVANPPFNTSLSPASPTYTEYNWVPLEYTLRLTPNQERALAAGNDVEVGANDFQPNLMFRVSAIFATEDGVQNRLHGRAGSDIQDTFRGLLIETQTSRVDLLDVYQCQTVNGVRTCTPTQSIEQVTCVISGREDVEPAVEVISSTVARVTLSQSQTASLGPGKFAFAIKGIAEDETEYVYRTGHFYISIC